jgi:hypothetical protein
MGNWEEATGALRQRALQDINDQSCQPCGCDAGANHLCQQHLDELLVDPRWVPMPVPACVTNITFVPAQTAPTRASVLPCGPAERKQFPVASGVLDYFPDAIAVIANVSYLGNEQHNPGTPLHWDRTKSQDESDTLMRHFLQRGTLDTDGIRHSAKMAWRALALLQKELEQENA